VEKISTGGIFMNVLKLTPLILAGAVAGAVNGLFGAGGGMILVPLLSLSGVFTDEEIFPTSISIILPICLVSLFLAAFQGPLPWALAMPYLFGSLIGGIIAGFVGKKIPTKWLHRGLGLLIIWGGIRYLC
jgi:uncharacterized membrane protein YfcA